MDSQQSVEDAFLAYRCSRDPAALATVYDNASPRLLSVAMHLTKSPTTAEDVVQDTFLVALENPERWDETKPLLPWLLGILSNRVRQVDGLSRRSIDPARLLVPDASDPLQDTEATELLAQVDEAITHLPQPYRGVVLLRLRNGLSPADISIALGRNPNTVRTQLARGIEMLRKVLPGSAALLLAGSLSAMPAAASSRQIVLQRATEVHAGLLARHRMAWIRRWSLAAAGVVAAAIAVWMSLRDPAEQPSTSPAPTLPVAAVTKPRPQPVQDRADEGAATVERSSAAPTGAARITVLVRGSGIPHALVELEPLRDTPRLFIHNYAYPNRHWRSIVSANPLGRATWREATTDADGICAFADLRPGYWVCRSLGVAEVFQVRPSARSNLQVVAPANTTVVRGTVLDSNRKPVRGAPIWKLNRQVRSTSVVVAHSDEHGRFQIAVPPRATLGAFLPGYAPVAVTVSATEWQQHRDVELQFVQPGARLEGRVLDENGEPCAGAVIEVGQIADLGLAWASKTAQVLARMHRTVTDVDGHYAFPSLVPGRTVVRARCKQHGVSQGAVDLRADGTTTHDLLLPIEAVLTGTVRAATGEPVEGVLVRVGGRLAFGYCSDVTDSQGRYELSGLSPGRCTVAVSDLRGGFAYQDLDLTAGAAATWNPVLLPENLTIAGQVLDARGQPFAGAWLVHHRGQDFDVHQLAADGNFRIAVDQRDAEAGGSLHVYDRDPRNARGVPSGNVRHALRGVRPGTEFHEIRLPDIHTSGSIRGRLERADGQPIEGTCTLFGSEGRSTWRIPIQAQADGRFHVGRMRPGSYDLRIPGTHRHFFGPIPVAANQDVDTGTIRVPATAFAEPTLLRRFSLLFPDRLTGSDAVEIEVRDRSGWIVNRKRQAASVHGAPNIFMNLPEGEFTVVATSASGLIATRTLVVDAQVRAHRAVLLEFRSR